MMWRTFGFEFQKRLFSNAGEKLSSHAYLFVGQDMIGKRTFALELAGKLVHANDIFLAGSDIDAIRDAKRFLSLSPLNGSFKIVIIDEANQMQDEAQNALLKILEEPSQSSILILITSTPDALLPTITSRCQAVEFSAHPKNTFIQYLQNKKLSEDQKEFLYQFSNGSIGLIEKLEDFKIIKNFAEELISLMKSNINHRFDLAKQFAVDPNLKQRVLFWMLYARIKKMYQQLPGLLSLYNIVSQPQFNEQLALENFMLSL